VRTFRWCNIPALTALSLSFLAAPAVGQDWKGTSRISGTVVDEAGKPVAGASVMLRVASSNAGPDLKTNNRGEFSALGLAGGAWNLDVSAPGYVTGKVSVTVPEQGRLPNVRVTLAADKAGAEAKQLQALLAKGNALVAAGKFAEARAEYEKVLAARPDLVEIHRSIALTYGREKNYAAALKELDQVLAQDPGNVQLLQLAVDSALQLGQLDLASRYLSQIDMAKVQDPSTITNIAVVALNRNQPTLAVRVLDPMVERFPQAAESYYYRALAELQLQQMEKAKADLEKFVAMAPPDSKEAQQAKDMLGKLKL
jgi:tetratricopeptide (TPR) repeat protein